MNLHLARKLQKLNILRENCSILQYFLKSVLKTIMLGSSTACRIFNDCHSPSSNFSFTGADRLYWLGEPALHTSLLNQLSIRLFWYVTQQASMLSYFSLLQAQQLRGIFYCIWNAGNCPSSHRCRPGNTILRRCLFFAALPESILDGIPVNWGWIVAPFAWGSSPLTHPASSRSVRGAILVSTGYSQSDPGFCS